MRKKRHQTLVSRASVSLTRRFAIDRSTETAIPRMRARRGDVIVVALDARACIYFDVSRTTRVKRRRDARDALEGDILC